MIYLSKRIVKPWLIFFNLIFVWVYVLIIITCLVHSYLWAVALSLLMILGNVTVVFLSSRNSKSTQYWLSEGVNTITIRYPNVWNDLEPLTLDVEQIVKMENHRVFSPAELFESAAYTLPLAVYVTFVHNGEKERKCIGHPDLDEISALCRRHGIPFEIR